MEKENPEAMLESDELKEVESGAVDIRCSVCHAASKVAYNRAAKRRLLLDEEGLTTLVYNELCYGTPLDMVEKEYPKYPGNPPLWGELYQVNKRDVEGGGSYREDEHGRGTFTAGKMKWVMSKLKKGATPDEKGGKEYNELIIKHSMISRACKAIREMEDTSGGGDDEEEEDRPDLSQAIYEYASRLKGSKNGGKAQELASIYCKPFCPESERSVLEKMYRGARKDEL